VGLRASLDVLEEGTPIRILTPDRMARNILSIPTTLSALLIQQNFFR